MMILRKNARKRSKPRGFTLMEIMVVILLITIVAAFMLPNYSRQVQKSHERDMAMQLRHIQLGSVHYRVMMGNYWISGGPENNLTTINSTLGINAISSDGTVYVYDDSVDPGNDFTATATWNNGVEDITFQIDSAGTITCMTANCLLTF